MRMNVIVGLTQNFKIYIMDRLSSLIEQLKHYYEVDIDNCVMTHESWIGQIAEAMTDPNYEQKFNEYYREYLEFINE